MGLRAKLQRWLADNAEKVGDADEGAETAAPDPAASDAKTTIKDAEATSLRAIKLPDEEREALDADEREP
ncbi:hypothetical protein EGH24_11515 [Halonotius terrestris]|uniref:Uncharacterized protein n=1 Tax=Halonotius terrestris TaxID=2487750 RepID=A0A8J8P7H2_9EURY|nr:hypothetical protein [Halonotius terrestris]TQQ79253.1 hypothetical protein EGH24_11515 [Halonotius terrestris]